MDDIRQLIKEVEAQEAALQFTVFSIETAHRIGLELMTIAKERNLPIAIDITRHGHQLFHVALEGSASDNDAWIKRKMNVVNRFSNSSYLVGLKLELKGLTMEEASLLDSFEYAAHGGSFPIIIKDTGVIGTITVSGLPSKEDHKLVVEVLEKSKQR